MNSSATTDPRPPGSGRRVVIEPLTRVEGHGKVTILLDAQGRVRQARLHIVEFRGFERFIQGRPYWEVPVLVQRLCGICPVSHHLAAAKAMDGIAGVDRIPPTAEKVRRLMHYGQVFQSHVLHFFHLCSPDLLFGGDADPAVRHIAGVARRYPGLALQAIRMRQYGQEIIEATAGRRIHGTGAVPGGVNQNLSVAARDRLLAGHAQMVAWARSGVQLARGFTLRQAGDGARMGAFPSSHLSLVRADGALDLYHGLLRAVDARGGALLDGVDVRDYLQHLAEAVQPWTFMKFPFLRALGPEQGWYRVGPLARLNTCAFIDTPEAEAARRDFLAALGGRPVHLSMAYHWARMIEVLHAIEKIGELLQDPDLQGADLRASGARRPEAVAAVEAPRGTLIHHYQVGDDDLVTRCNLIVATTHNNTALHRAVEQAAAAYLTGARITEGLLNRIEMVIRAYDPCLSCATHSLGQMPLDVELRGAQDERLDHMVRSGRS